jgi:hypothetical protein
VSRNSLKFVIGLSQPIGHLAESWFANSPFAQGIEQVGAFAAQVTVSLPMRMHSSHLQLHDPEELTSVEQTPITIGGPGDLTQTAFPIAEDPTPGKALEPATGALFVLS